MPQLMDLNSSSFGNSGRRVGWAGLVGGVSISRGVGCSECDDEQWLFAKAAM